MRAWPLFFSLFLFDLPSPEFDEQDTNRSDEPKRQREIEGMRFYYFSFFSMVLLGLIYFAAMGLLVLVGSWLRKRWKRAWLAILPLAAVLVVAPVAEEFWIAYRFGQLCQDAGAVVHRRMRVAGFYNDTRPTHDGPRTPQGAEELDQSGYRFYELKFRDTSRVVHLEKANNKWVVTVLDRPTARYWYKWPERNARVGHKIYKNSEAVVDMQTGEVLGTSVRYGRKAPWFFIALDAPGMDCPRRGHDPMRKPGLLYKTVLEPIAQD
jgi:hypothetical protein